jgi:hypothetical protein
MKFVFWIVSVLCVFTLGACSKSRKAETAAGEEPAPAPVAASVTDATPAPPPPPPAPGTEAASAPPPDASTPAASQDNGSEYAANMNKLQKYKKWVFALLDGSEADKAAVRKSYQALSAAEKKEFENYCRSAALKFP